MCTALSLSRSGARLTLAWLLLASQAEAQRLFVGGDAFPLPSYANALRVDDFNADGTPDVAVTHGSDGTVSVLLGGQTPLLGEAQTYAAGLGVVYVTSGDLNGDRFPELVLVNSGASSVSVLINEGDGTFRAGGEHPVGIEPRVAELGDFNADGAADVVATNLQSRDLQTLLGDGSGGFSDAGRIPVGDNPHHLTLGDLDGDGRTDVAVAHTVAVTWFRSLADGTFERALDVRLDSNPRVLTSGDLNADGHVDLAVVTGTGTLLFLENPGDGRFEVKVAGMVPDFSFGPELVGFLVPVDFDLDGVLDVATRYPDRALRRRGGPPVSRRRRRGRRRRSVAHRRGLDARLPVFRRRSPSLEAGSVSSVGST
jgi:hypothetical protein